MKITAHIDDNNVHTKHYFSGRYALEYFILKLLETYFGTEIKSKVESLLKLESSEKEFNLRRAK